MKLTLTGPNALVLGVALTACTSDKDEPFVGRVSRSAFVEYHDKETTPLCKTLLQLLDEHARRIGGLIGYEPSNESPIRYYKFASKADFAEGQDQCEPDPGACALGDAVSRK